MICLSVLWTQLHPNHWSNSFFSLLMTLVSIILNKFVTSGDHWRIASGRGRGYIVKPLNLSPRYLSVSLFLSLYISLYLYLSISIYIYISLSIYISIYTSLYMYIFVCIYMYMYLYIYICVRMCVCMYVCMYVCV